MRMQKALIGLGLTVVALLAALLAVAAPAMASSHREAPAITKMPKVDGTDFYMFNSYEPGRSGYVTLIANYIPLQDAYGGPNYFTFDPDAVYRIHIDNTGDGVEDITFQFRFGELLRDIQLPVGGKNVSIPLVNAGPISTNYDPTVNRVESYTVRVIRGPVDGGGQGAGQSVTNAAGGGTRFLKPIDNIGQKTFANYGAYARSFLYNISIPGCSGQGKVFVGQRKDSFSVNLGEVFDLVNIDNPLGPRNSEADALADKNVTTIALEVPASCLTKNSGSPVIGGWTTAAIRRTSTLNDNPTFNAPATGSGEFVQVSRLGAPLVNELVIGLKDKNKFNASSPKDDGQFADYVTNPTLPAILELLFGGAGVKAPTNFPRKDLIATFLTGIDGVNKLGGPAEELRLNTSIAATPAGSQSNLGALGGDNAGFPNGRRPGDDVVDITLRAAMGVLCHAFPGVFCNPADAPSGNLPFTDGTLQDASQFQTVFPYLKDPLPGSPNGPNGLPPS
jgi:uncharacterized protein DUF4331